MLRCDWGPQWGSARLVTRAARKHSALRSKTIVTLRRLSSLVCFDTEVGEGLWYQVFCGWERLWIQASAQDTAAYMGQYVCCVCVMAQYYNSSWCGKLYIICCRKLCATQNFSYVNHLTQGFLEPLICPVLDESVRELIVCLFSRWWRWPPAQQHRERRGHGRGWHPSSQAQGQVLYPG